MISWLSLNWLPIVGHSFVLLGVMLLAASMVFKNLPYIGSNTNAYILLSCILLVIGFFIEGYCYSNLKNRLSQQVIEQTLHNEIQRLEKLVEESKKASATTNERIDQTVKQVNTQSQKRKTQIKERIVEVEKLINKECSIPLEAIEIHNMAAEPTP